MNSAAKALFKMVLTKTSLLFSLVTLRQAFARQHAIRTAKGRDGGVGAGLKPALPPGTSCLLLA
jgi:hypothetical protein